MRAFSMIYDADSGRVLGYVGSGSSKLRALAYDKSGFSEANWSPKKHLQIKPSGSKGQNIQSSGPWDFCSLAWSPGSTRVAGLTRLGRLGIWDAASKTILLDTELSDDRYGSLRWCPRGKLLALLPDKGGILILRAEDGTRVHGLQGTKGRD